MAESGIEIGEVLFEIIDDLKAVINDPWDIKEFVDQEGLAVGGRMVYIPEGD